MGPKGIVQQVCDCPAKILLLLKEIMDQKVSQLLPPAYDHTKPEVRIHSLADDSAESHVETSCGRDHQRSTHQPDSTDPGRTTIWSRSETFADTITLCSIPARKGRPSCSPATWGQGPKISRLHSLFRVRSNPNKGIDCPTPYGHSTQTR